MTLLGYWLRKASSPLIFALGSVACTAATYALYSAGSLITGAAACPAGGVVGCPWAGCVVLWPTAPTAIPSTTVSRIFFISMAPWIFWGIALLGNVFLKLAATAFRLDHSASGSCFGMPGFLAGRREKEVFAGTHCFGPVFPDGRIISTSSSEGKRLPN